MLTQEISCSANLCVLVTELVPKVQSLNITTNPNAVHCNDVLNKKKRIQDPGWKCCLFQACQEDRSLQVPDKGTLPGHAVL